MGAVDLAQSVQARGKKPRATSSWDPGVRIARGLCLQRRLGREKCRKLWLRRQRQTQRPRVTGSRMNRCLLIGLYFWFL